VPTTKHRKRSMYLLHLLCLCKELSELQLLNEGARDLSLAGHFLVIAAFAKQRCHPVSANQNKIG
jgi:hypothetical protein